ncbi:hypothetical protein ACIOD1_13020 [Streptomyces sp. NPDC088097]|uniref:hypothetical protein n=1 Tax=Streptomyces sp. NPDC088097 TaxID=3365823 RepID=UPI003818B38A
MARIYASADQYEAHTGTAAPVDIEARIARASRFLDANVFRMCSYSVDTATGLPADSAVAEALASAVCAQVEWGVEVGDVTGAAAAGWGTVEIGDVRLGRSVTSVSGDASAARQVAPAVWDALQSPDLAAVGFRLGAVSVWG